MFALFISYFTISSLLFEKKSVVISVVFTIKSLIYRFHLGKNTPSKSPSDKTRHDKIPIEIIIMYNSGTYY